MRENPIAVGSVRLVLLICIPAALLLSNLYLLATPVFIRYEYSKPQFPPSDIYNPAERLSLAEASLYYLRSDEGVEYLRNLRSNKLPVYNAREIRHMVDVKMVMRGARWVHGICSMLCILALAFSWRSARLRTQALRAVYQACLALVVGLVAIGTLAYTSFDLFFTAFHRVFFAGDSWLFAFTDTLIQLFPVQFWMDATWALSLLTVGECIIVGVAAYALQCRQREVP
jgi:integral membrane protein (TIGR01906 family)